MGLINLRSVRANESRADPLVTRKHY